jgi:hypothetical protein
MTRRTFLTSHTGKCPVPICGFPDPATAIDVPLDSPSTPVKAAAGSVARSGYASTPLGAFETPNATPRHAPETATKVQVGQDFDSTVSIGEVGSRLV